MMDLTNRSACVLAQVARDDIPVDNDGHWKGDGRHDESEQRHPISSGLTVTPMRHNSPYAIGIRDGIAAFGATRR